MPFKGQEATEFATMIGALAAMFGRELDTPTLLGYELGLDDLPMRDIAKAVRQAIRTHPKFMPTVAELRDLVDMPLTDRANRAWMALKQAVARSGAYASISFDDPALNATVRNLGGWEAVCATEAGETFDKWLRLQFERVYLSFCRHGMNAEMAAPLIGICDRQNGSAGYLAHVEEPKRIGTGLKPLPALLGNGKGTPRIGKSTPQVGAAIKRIGKSVE